MADDHDHQIGGKVVGALVMQLLAAGVAAVRDFQEGTEHVALAAGRALAAQAVPEVGFQGVLAHAPGEIRPRGRAINARAAAPAHSSFAKS